MRQKPVRVIRLSYCTLCSLNSLDRRVHLGILFSTFSELKRHIIKMRKLKTSVKRWPSKIKTISYKEVLDYKAAKKRIRTILKENFRHRRRFFKRIKYKNS